MSKRLLAIAAWLLIFVLPVNADELTQANSACLRGTWAAQTRDTKIASYGIQFDGNGRVWITLAADAAYVPSHPKMPLVRDIEIDSARGKLFFSIPDAGRFYLQEIVTDNLLLIRSDDSSLVDKRQQAQIHDTAFERTSATLTCLNRSSVVGAPAPSGAVTTVSDEDYHPAQALDGFGAIFIAVGEPVLFPIDRAKTCKAESGSDLNASGCAVVGFVVSPFLFVRDALVGLGDIVTGGYFRLSRKSGVFRYFEKD